MRTVILQLSALLLAAWYVPRAVFPVLLANVSRPAVIQPAPDVTQRIIMAAADAGLPPRIALLRFWHESRWKHSNLGKVIESQGNCGISQLNRKYTRNACLMTEAESIREGVRQLAGYWSEFGDERLVVLAYVSGPTVARRRR